MGIAWTFREAVVVRVHEKDRSHRARIRVFGAIDAIMAIREKQRIANEEQFCDVFD